MTREAKQGRQHSRVVVIDPALRDAGGHHEHLAIGYARAIGLTRCWFAVHREHGALHQVEAGRIIGAFATSYYELVARARLGRVGLAFLRAWNAGRLVRDPAVRRRVASAMPVRALVSAARALSRRLRPARPARLAPAPPAYVDELLALIDQNDLGPGDHLAFVSVEGQTALAALWLLAMRPPECLPTMHLRFMFDDRGFRTAAADYTNLVGRLGAADRSGARLHLYAETEALARAMAVAAGTVVDLAPYPPRVPAASETSRPPDGPVVLGFLGEARREKGFHLLEGLLEAFAREHPARAARVRVLVHAGGASAEATELAGAFADWARGAPLPVEVICGVLPAPSYAAMLERIDVLLCPMDATIYAARGSGVAQEAAAAGKVVLRPRGLSLDELDPAGVGMASGQALTAADLAAVVEDFPARARAARAAADMVKARFADSPLILRCRTQVPAPDAPRTRLMTIDQGDAPPVVSATELSVWVRPEGMDAAAAVKPFYTGPVAPGVGILTLACVQTDLPNLLQRLARGGWVSSAVSQGKTP